MKKIKALLLFALSAACVVGCATFPDAGSTAKLAEQIVAEAYGSTAPGLKSRTLQDAPQHTCSAVGDAKLSQAQSAAIVKTARDGMGNTRAIATDKDSILHRSDSDYKVKLQLQRFSWK